MQFITFAGISRYFIYSHHHYRPRSRCHLHRRPHPQHGNEDDYGDVGNVNNGWLIVVVVGGIIINCLLLPLFV